VSRWRLLWLLYAAFIVYGGTIPFHFSGSFDDALVRLRELPLSPLISPDTGGRVSIPDTVQNLLLFVPFGALGFLGVGGHGGRSRRGHGGGEGRGGAGVFRQVLLVTGAALLLSLLVESLQLLTNDRIASVADVTTNTAGAVVGAVTAWVAHGAVRAGLWRLRREGLDVPEFHPLAVSSRST
jgi:hypothetical protein